MDELILRSIKGRTTADEEKQLLLWRAASAENDVHFRLIVALLTGYESMEASQGLPAAPTVSELTGRDGGRNGWPAWRPKRWRISQLARAAAVAAVVALAPVTILFMQRSGKAPEAAQFVTGTDERAIVQLGDGTVVRLGPESRLQVPDSDQQREVRLIGRAYFAVAKMQRQPFTIHTAAGTIQVLGTRFDLETRDEDLRLVVVEGTVAVSTRERRTTVTAHEMSRIVRGQQLATVPVEDALRFVEWAGNFLAFQSTPLSAAAREIEQTYGVRVVIADPVVANRVITAWFTDRPLSDVLRVVCLAVAAHCTTEGDVVRITSADRSRNGPI